jgi:hypothetical protein
MPVCGSLSADTRLTTRVPPATSHRRWGKAAVLYYESKMQRALSIFLILFFGLGPLAEALPANEDARLPLCCRRHGAHHCAMTPRIAAMTGEDTSGKAIFTAPATCPDFPDYLAASLSTIHALAASPISLPVLLAQAHAAAAGRAAARLRPIRTRAGRGPPASDLA